DDHRSPGERNSHLLRGGHHAKAQSSGLIGSRSAEESILNRPSLESRHPARIPAHLQHLQVFVDIQPVLAKKIAKALVGGRAEARDAGEFSSELRDTFDIRVSDEVGS